jgi:RNA polymerase sigma factor (sigma-70 family)
MVLKHESMMINLVAKEEDLISGIKSNDSKALETVYKLHYPMILHFILNNSGSDQEAKDIYQEAVIILYEKIKEENFELSCKIKTYIYSVCRRLWLKALTEKRKFGGPIIESETFIDMEAEMPGIEEKEMQYTHMSAALIKLGEPCKTLIEDFYMKGLSMPVITEKYGYTNADNAKNQKYKCLMRLKKIFFLDYKS